MVRRAARFSDLSGQFCDFEDLDKDEVVLSATPGNAPSVRYGAKGRCRDNYAPGYDWFLPEYVGGSDYSGALAYNSNHTVLLQLCGELDEELDDSSRLWFLDLYGGYGTFGLALHVERTPDEVVQLLKQLEDYPVADEDRLSDLEREMEEEAWTNWAERDYRRALEVAFAEQQGSDVEVDADEVEQGDLQDHFHQWGDEIGEYWETSGQERYIDVTKIAKAAAEAGYPPEGLRIQPTYEAGGEDIRSENPELEAEAERLRRSQQFNGLSGDNYWGAEELFWMTEEEPSFEHTPAAGDDRDIIYNGRRVRWAATSHHTVLVPVDKVLFMEGNIWDAGHASALHDMVQRGGAVFEPPAGRLYRIDADDVARTKQWYEEDELEYQMNMERPWEDSDAGTFYVQLLDGNHRALAAMAAGESQIPVVVGENYWEDVRDDEWLTLDGLRGVSSIEGASAAERRERLDPPATKVVRLPGLGDVIEFEDTP